MTQPPAPKTRSPLRDRPLRNPGESVQEARRRLQLDLLSFPLAVVCGALTAAVVETIGYLFNQPRQPVFYLVLFVIALSWVAWRIWRVRPALRAYKLAEEGEKAVGQYLEKLRSDGYEIFHDVPGGGFNIDHVLIGPTGIYTVETKTWSKPTLGDPKIVFNGESLTASGMKPERDPIKQSRGQVSWIATLLKESTGRQFTVRGVVLFPGWFVEQGEGTLKEIWVLNPKALPAFLGKAKVMLSPEDVKLAAYHLSRYVRGAEVDDS
jgi:hypothetical protein